MLFLLKLISLFGLSAELIFVNYQVGDNVGDCAARGADLFESIAAEIISAMILGGTMAQRCKIEGLLIFLTTVFEEFFWAELLMINRVQMIEDPVCLFS